MFELKKCPNLGYMIYPATCPWVGKSIRTYSESHTLEAEFLTSLVDEGDCVIDAGAYVGTITIPLARKVAPTGKVISFECQRPIYCALCGNVALNNLHDIVQPLNHVAYVVSGQRAYVHEIDYSKEMSFGSVCVSKEPTSNPVTTLRIDDFNLDRLRLMKVDVEGMEWDVIRGADITIRKCRPFIYFEALPEMGYGLSVSICEHLEKLQYEWYAHEPPVFNPNNVEGVEENVLKNSYGNDTVGSNVFAYPKEQAKKIAKSLENEYLIKDLENSDKSRHQAFFKARKERERVRAEDGRVIII